MSDDVKKMSGWAVVQLGPDAILARHREASAADETAVGTSAQTDSKTEYIKATRLRRIMEDPRTSVRARFLATDDYKLLLPNFGKDSPEFNVGAPLLRKLMEGWFDGFQQKITIQTYQELAERFSRDSALVYREATALRALMENPCGDVVVAAFKAYEYLIPKFADGSPEVYMGAKAVRNIMSGLGGMDWEAARVYDMLVKRFKADSGMVSEADDALQFYMHKPWLKRGMGEVFKQNFHHLSSIGFFKAAFESGSWIDGLGVMGFSEKAVRNLRGFANQPGFIGFRESVMTVLDSFCELTPDKTMVLNRVFEATDPGKWKSVRNTLSTLRALAALDSLPERLRNGFYGFRRDVAGDPRALLRAGSEKTLIDFLHAVIGDKGALRLLFMDEAQKSGEALKLWRHVQAVRNFLSSKGLLSLFAQSASFMNGDGRKILKNLLGELATSPIVDGELRYQKRYDRMVERLGFSPQFVEKWRKEWKKVYAATGAVMDEGEARKLVMDQAAAQLAVHVNSTPGKEGEFKDLPDSLRALISTLERGEANIDKVKGLHEIMELNYARIREIYGDLFANSRIDLKNLRTGLMKGVRLAKRSEATEISGRVDRLAFHGMIPTETCQRLSSLYAESTNGSGQPLNKLLWGQFKLANYVMDGEVMARRMLEVTRDGEGIEHLLVERSYTAGGFAGFAQFDEDIIKHARELGIDQDRVHFLDRHEKRPVPNPLATGALMYRDSGLPEIHPAMTMPFRPVPFTPAPTAMMSARVMLRTGT